MLARKRPRLTRLAVEPLEERRLLAVMSFQDGVLPTPDYAGTRDVSLFGAEEGVNFGDATTLRADAEQGSTGEPVWSLIKWDLSGIPADATINDVSITVNVSNTSAAPGFNLLAMRTAWIESEATWIGPTSTSTWEEPGVTDPSDFNPTVLGTMIGAATGPLTVLLNSAGRAVVAGWLADSASNHGLLLSNPANSNSLRFDSREATTAANRPKLSIDFTFNDVDPPTATLIDPLDNGPADEDDDEGEVRVGVRDSFVIQLDDFALDDVTVTAETLTISKDAAPFSEFTFAFDAAVDQITLLPTAGNFGVGEYTVSLNDGDAKIADASGNEMPVTTFDIIIDTTIPVTVDDAYNAVEDTLLVVDPDAGLLDNDFITDPAANAVLVAAPTNGTATINDDGSFTYQPDENFFGSDTFTYRAVTGQFESNVSTVHITIAPVNDRPVAVDDSYAVNAGETIPRHLSYSEVVLSDGPIGYWRLGESAGSALAIDLVGGFDGTYSNGVSLGQPGSVALDENTSARFDGSTGYVDLGFHSEFDLRNDFTIEAWILPESGGRIFSNRSSSGGYSLGLIDRSQLVFTTFISRDFVPSVALSSNQWHHVVVVFDGSNDATFYVDGVFADRVEGNVPAGNSSSPANIGRNPCCDLQYFRGSVDEVALYGHTLTNEQVREHYLAGVADANGPTVKANVLANDEDLDGDSLTATLVDSAQHGSASLSIDGSITYQHDDGFTGIDTFTYVASDGQATSNVATVTIRVGVEEVLADLTGNGFVDFEDLTVLLAAWNQNVSAAEGNLVDAGTSPVNFEDLTVLLAAWTGPGPAGAPQAAVRSDRLQPVEIDRMNPVTTSARKDVAYDSDSAVMLKHNLRNARRTAARSRPAGGIYGRLQAVAVDAVLAEEGSPRQARIQAAHKLRRQP